jgi:poly(hydroxyalkanoate) depolymerase family esterase
MNLSKMGALSPNMKEAMKLMQSGQLQAATDVLQRNLGGAESVAPLTAEQPDNQFGQTAFNSLPNSGKLQSFADKMSRFKLELPTGLGQGAGFDFNHEEALPDKALFLKKTLKDRQGSHDYRLYVPSGYQQAVDKGANLPLVIMLHGCTQSPEDFAAGTRMNQLAEQNNCLIAYPSQPATANQNRCWNWFRSSDQQQGQGEPAWLAELTRTITEDYAVDASRVYIAGLSAGAAMAVIMAETYPALYAGVGVHSGLAYGSANDLPSAMMAMSQGGALAATQATQNHPFVPMIVFHGDQDHTVSIRNGEQVFNQAKQRLQSQETDLQTHRDQRHSDQGKNSTLVRITDKQGVDQLEYWKIHGAGHSWAGGSRAGTFTDPTGPDASEEMMRFFLSH